MKNKELVFVVYRVTLSDLTNPQNKVTQFLNAGEVNSVVHLSYMHNPQSGDNCEVAILYEKTPTEPDNKDQSESAEMKPLQKFKKRSRPGPLR